MHSASLEEKLSTQNTKTPNPLVPSFLVLGKQHTALKLIAFHSNKYTVLDYFVF